MIIPISVPRQHRPETKYFLADPWLLALCGWSIQQGAKWKSGRTIPSFVQPSYALSTQFDLTSQKIFATDYTTLTIEVSPLWQYIICSRLRSPVVRCSTSWHDFVCTFSTLELMKPTAVLFDRLVLLYLHWMIWVHKMHYHLPGSELGLWSSTSLSVHNNIKTITTISDEERLRPGNLRLVLELCLFFHHFSCSLSQAQITRTDPSSIAATRFSHTKTWRVYQIIDTASPSSSDIKQSKHPLDLPSLTHKLTNTR